MTVFLDVETRIEWVEVLLGVFGRHCRQLGCDTDATHWMEAAVREAVTNGMRHGNRMDPAKRLRMRIETAVPGPSAAVPEPVGACGGEARAAAGEISVSVEDEGEGFDTELVPDPLAEDNLLKASGRGIFFMRQFMDEVRWSRAPGGGTRVRLVHRHAAPAS